MEFVRQLLNLYRHAAKEASIALYRNPLLLLGTIVSLGIYLFAGQLFGRGGFFGGMIVGLVQVVLISVWYCWLRDVVSYQRLAYRGMYQLDGSLFSAVINTGFVLFIGKLLLSFFLQGTGNQEILLIVQFGLVIICNALPETLYLQRSDGIEAIVESARFTRQNWIEWFIPFIILVAPWIFVSVDILLILIAKMEELLPATVVFNSMKLFTTAVLARVPYAYYIGLGVGLISFTWYSLFRGFLFQELQRGSRRQRVFVERQR